MNYYFAYYMKVAYMFFVFKLLKSVQIDFLVGLDSFFQANLM